MTTHELANTFERCARALRTLPDGRLNDRSKPMLDGDYAVGAAILWSYLRDLFTDAGKDVFRREEILVLLDVIQSDPDMFPPDLIAMVADARVEDEG
jgi:hypothetical protein